MFANWLEQRPCLRLVLVTLYYFAILVALVTIYGPGNFSTPSFVYQGF